MSGRYGAFTFCDRITEHVPATRARATFAVPAALGQFSSCLVAEATGQLAAWVSMAHIGFSGRPVAALAREVRIHGDVRPGDSVSLEVDIGSCDAEAVFYQGRARVAGRVAVELVDCLGPMLPQDDYDSADDLARQFALLCGPGAAPGRFHGVGDHAMETETAGADSRVARLHVPVDAPYFCDHFPRRAVFPATLLLDHAIRVATALVDVDPAQPRRVARVQNVKMRDFIAPGEDVLLHVARIAPRNADDARVKLTATIGERTMATAQIGFARAVVEAA
jgi:3-hydroxymyristoyl/3-hydroxydecanoyl-(acyl carrier protein) dehydratase